jgi:hypothetical protein
MDEEVRLYTRSCPSCQCNKSSTQLKLGQLQPLPIPERNWSSVSLDLITALPVTPSGHDSILTVVDRLSKMFVTRIFKGLAPFSFIAPAPHAGVNM